MGWDTLPDTTVLRASDSISIKFYLTCAPFTSPSPDDFRAELAKQNQIATVYDVSWNNFENLVSFAAGYEAILGPVDGTQAADMRNAVLTAMVAVNTAKMIPCGSLNVVQVQRQNTKASTVEQVAGSFKWAAIATVVVVGFIVVRRFGFV